MILDTGILTILRSVDTSEPGGMPSSATSPLCRRRYGTLSFGSRKADPTGARPDRRIDAKVRILRFPDLREGDLVILSDAVATGVLTPAYTVESFYHGLDTDSGEDITDVNLQRYEKAVVLP